MMRRWWMLMSMVALGCNTAPTSQPVPDPPPTVAAAPAPAPPPPPDPIDTIRALSTWQDAFDVAKPTMIDEFDRSSPGTHLFATWAMVKLGWEDVAVVQDETTPARIKKDIDTERGKRLCARGSIIEIGTVKKPHGTSYVGLLKTSGVNLIHFRAVGSSGDIVERSSARFCGVVTGRFSYRNSAGGTGHGIDVVGMFDLPENRTRAAVTPPAKPAAPSGPPKTVSINDVPSVVAPPAAAPPPQPAATPAANRGACNCPPGDISCAMKCSTGQR